jgi:oligosaccharide repeat unit polymerase
MTGRLTVELRQLFSPLALVGLVYVPLFVLFLATSPSLFESEFGSTKHLTGTAVLYFAISITLFAFAAAVGRSLGLRRPLRYAFEQAALTDDYRLRRLAPFLRGLLFVSLLAYLAWFAAGAIRAGGPTQLIRTWLSNPFLVKTELLRTVPGLTTLTQLAVAAIPLALVFGLLGRRSKLRPLVTTILLLAVARSFVFSERLAVLELVVPATYLLLAERRVTVSKAVLWGLGLGFAVLVVFTATELRRTYTYTHNFSLPRVTVRFFGYYLTSIDNGSVIIDRYPAATPFANTGQMLWRFPVVSNLSAPDLPGLGTVSLRYADIFGRDPDTFWPPAFAAQGLSYQYNVFTTPGFLAADFGWFALPVVFLLGLYSGALYTRARSSPFHRALYAVWLVGLLEFMRILYFFDTRLLPAYLAFAAVYVSIARRARVPSPITQAPPAARPLAASSR